MENKTIIRTLILLVVLLALYVLATAAKNLVPPKGEVEEPVACTLDAKLCPDGSYVGRVPPNCEFAVCPGEVSVRMPQPAGDVNLETVYPGITAVADNSAWKTYKNDKAGFEFKYPADLIFDEKQNIVVFGSAGQGDQIALSTQQRTSSTSYPGVLIIRLAPSQSLSALESYQLLGDPLPQVVYNTNFIGKSAFLFESIPGFNPHDEIVLSNNGHLLTIQPWNPIGEQVLSTFKFTK